jgi:ribose-phosphate pyrophosphokinase
MTDFAILAGSANPALGEAVARALGVPLGACRIERFPGGELSVLLRQTVRGRRVFLLQPTSPPVNDHLVELLAFADACRRASADRVTAIVPYFGYARSDRRNNRRQPIMSSLVAQLLQCAGVDRVLMVDPHTPQLEGFFHLPVDSLSAVARLSDAVRASLPVEAEPVVVAPDAGRVPMATAYAQRLGLPLVVLHKRRSSGRDTQATHLVGDVRGRRCLIVDDIISTGGTILESVRALREAGARPDFHVAATHGLLLGDACDRLAAAGVREIVVTDTVAQPPPPHRHPAVRVASIAPLIAAGIGHQMSDKSMEELY